MRQFVVLGHDAPTTPDFPLDALPSEAGRLDALCRSVTAALLLSHGIREDARIHLVLQDELTISIDGSEVRNLNPDERSTAALIRTALEHRDDAIGHQPAEPSPGVSLTRMGFEATLESTARDSTVVQLHPESEPITALEPPTDPLFVLSDHRDFTDDEAALLDEHADRRVSLSPERLHGSQAITVAHNYLDTGGFEQY